MEKLEIAAFANNEYYATQKLKQAKKRQNIEFVKIVGVLLLFGLLIFITGMVEGIKV